ncbi:MAG: nitroreductase [Bacillales bacterium]|jgi:nitroreductase|nr:nitroreductase [Bacillales bacterium]
MIFEKSLIESMKKRYSVRTFDEKNITDAHFDKISTYISDEQNLTDPFGKINKIELVKVTKNVSDKGLKLGTYGIIKNPRGYLIGITKNDKYSIVGSGYTLQKLIILLTELGIGTCWMGGTFSRSSFEKEIELNEGEFIPCITPIGYPLDNKSFIDKTLRFLAKSDNRKSWDQIVFDSHLGKPLSKSDSGLLETPLEMVRIGPSASNKQPWRIIVSEDRTLYHFYIEHTPNYNRMGYDMQMLDMGIAIAQFELACNELNLKGDWVLEEPMLDLPSSPHTEYIVSWKIK